MYKYLSKYLLLKGAGAGDSHPCRRGYVSLVNARVRRGHSKIFMKIILRKNSQSDS